LFRLNRKFLRGASAFGGCKLPLALKSGFGCRDATISLV